MPESRVLNPVEDGHAHLLSCPDAIGPRPARAGRVQINPRGGRTAPHAGILRCAKEGREPCLLLAVGRRHPRGSRAAGRVEINPGCGRPTPDRRSLGPTLREHGSSLEIASRR